VYNFGPAPAKGHLSVAGPKEWPLSVPTEVAVDSSAAPNSKLGYDLSAVSRLTLQTVEVRGDFGPAGKAILSLRLLPELRAEPKTARDLPSALTTDR